MLVRGQIHCFGLTNGCSAAV
ncbi:hypothetical protein HU200_059987 [Digitaria exilis]|uniref:Uncharacterized protein n=1 Tax=Digitaria exilis TaxID=1010633 RepID=A0A835E0S6_9POAL|nr:hypothetical protein HU200_059987 [Digitaria exilis]